MLAICARDMPHLERATLDSSRGSTVTPLSPIATLTSSGTTNDSSPLDPFTRTCCPSIVAVTPDGTTTGFLPTRDIARLPILFAPLRRSEDLAEHFAADVLLASLVIGHHALRRRQDHDPEPVRDLRHGVDRSVDTTTGLRDPLDAPDHRLTVEVFQLDLELGAAIAELGRRVVADVAFRLQDIEHAGAQPGAGGHDRTAAAHLRVADTGQHIAQGIVHRHMSVSLTSSTSRDRGSGPETRAPGARY